MNTWEESDLTRRLYWENPYLFETDAKIERIDSNEEGFQVTLDRSIFYPDMSGGQPGDDGTINSVKVIRTYEDGDKLVHVVQERLAQGRANLKISGERRMDLMQQHSGQHLLSGVLFRLFGTETIGFHLGEEYTTIDLNVTDISEDELTRAEQLCNKIIQSNFRIKSYVVSSDEVRLLPVRKRPSVDKNIRVVEIDGFDYSPCGGTHVSATGELGLIKVIRREKYKGNTRIYFLTGKRAVNDYINKFNSVRDISAVLSTGDTQVFERFSAIYNERNSLLKDVKELKERLLSLEGENLLRGAKLHGEGRIICRMFDNKDFKEISYMGSWLTNTNERLVLIFGIEGSSISQFMISKSKDVELELNDIYKELSSLYQIKGGGNSNTVQGSISSSHLNGLLERCLGLVMKAMD
jgi:alanyl-tRNA synthetase